MLEKCNRSWLPFCHLGIYSIEIDLGNIPRNVNFYYIFETVSGTFLVYEITKRMIFDRIAYEILQNCTILIIHKIVLNPQSYNSYIIITICL